MPKSTGSLDHPVLHPDSSSNSQYNSLDSAAETVASGWSQLQQALTTEPSEQSVPVFGMLGGFVSLLNGASPAPGDGSEREKEEAGAHRRGKTQAQEASAQHQVDWISRAAQVLTTPRSRGAAGAEKSAMQGEDRHANEVDRSRLRLRPADHSDVVPDGHLTARSSSYRRGGGKEVHVGKLIDMWSLRWTRVPKFVCGRLSFTACERRINMGQLRRAFADASMLMNHVAGAAAARVQRGGSAVARDVCWKVNMRRCVACACAGCM
jgi:hypothetical protein